MMLGLPMHGISASMLHLLPFPPLTWPLI